jgi:hypothetical protein
MTIKEFSPEDMKAHAVDMKVGLLATVNLQGLPHMTLISTLRGYSPTGMVWGQFAEGMSKQNILQNPKVGWLILTLDKNIWRGKAQFTHTAITGPEYEFFNNTPLFRYNAYFGIHKVYYMDLLGQTGKTPLPMNSVVSAEIRSIIARTISPSRNSPVIMNDWTKKLIDKLDNLKFISYVGEDGFPVIIPVIQTQTDGSGKLIFSVGAFGDEIRRIPQGKPVAFFCMSFSMEDILIRGTFLGCARRSGFLCGSMDMDWVYSPMPPVAAQVYPPLNLEPVRDF